MSFHVGLDPGAGVCAPPTWSGLVPPTSLNCKKAPIVTKCMVLLGSVAAAWVWRTRSSRRRDERDATTIYSVVTTLLILLKNPQWNREQ